MLELFRGAKEEDKKSIVKEFDEIKGFHTDLISSDDMFQLIGRTMKENFLSSSYIIKTSMQQTTA